MFDGCLIVFSLIVGSQLKGSSGGSKDIGKIPPQGQPACADECRGSAVESPLKCSLIYGKLADSEVGFKGRIRWVIEGADPGVGSDEFDQMIDSGVGFRSRIR